MCVDQIRVGRRVKHFIPVSKPVKSYLDYWFPDNKEVSKEEFLGMWCITALTRKTKQTKFFTSCAEDTLYLKSRKMTDTWSFFAPVRYQDSVILPKRRVFEFNNMIIQCMNTEVLQDMELRRTRGDQNHIQASINAFRDKYKIRDNSFEDERIRKMYLRFRSKQDEMHGFGMSAFLPGLFLGKLV